MQINSHIQLSRLSFYTAIAALLMVGFYPLKAYSNESTLSNFTSSISSVYTASKSCEKTIAPGPQEYISLITEYFAKLYPNGTAYWVIPETVALINDPSTCIRLIQKNLVEYRNARIQYRSTYPERMPAPILVAYQWERGYYEPTHEEPAKSYIPDSKSNNKKSAKEKFAGTNLQ